MFPIRCHGRNAGPEKNGYRSLSVKPRDRYSCCHTYSWPLNARGALTPFMASQSIMACHWSKLYHTNE